MFQILSLARSFTSLFGRRKDLGSHTEIDAVVEFVVPNFTGSARLALDAVLAGLVIGQGFWTSGDARFANVLHLVNGFVFVSLTKHDDQREKNRTAETIIGER